ncbi:MAG TPA: transposase [Terriglobia bacterium]|nr:transposase [Terriglobia bacterium]
MPTTRLASDPGHKLLVGRDPVEGADLASQPTLSRFENAPDRQQMARLAEALADVVIERHRRRLQGRARRITIDLEPTDDPTHGARQLALFNGHYDTWCYLPLLGLLSFNDELEQYPFTAVLRSGKAVTWQGAGGLVLREVEKRTGISGRFAVCFRDSRKPEQVEHTVKELVAQRVYALALGDEGLNDHEQLPAEPWLAVPAEKADPRGESRARARDRGKALAGKSTLNRLDCADLHLTRRLVDDRLCVA